MEEDASRLVSPNTDDEDALVCGKPVEIDDTELRGTFGADDGDTVVCERPVDGVAPKSSVDVG